MELFDVVDKNRKKRGYTKPRGEKLEENEYNVGVEIWVFNKNRLLMTKRSLEKSHPGEWEVPGGCSQSGEDSIDTLIREVKEEIGISIKEDDVQLIGTQLYKKQFVDIYKTNKSINLDDIVLQKEEVINVKFITKKEFMDMASNNEIVKSVYNRYEQIKDKLEKDW